MLQQFSIDPNSSQTIFLSKVDHLVLSGCNLKASNSAVLASAVATIRSVDLSEVQLQPQQVREFFVLPFFFLSIFAWFLPRFFFTKVAEVLRKSASAKGLYYLSLDGVQVPEELLREKSEDTVLSKMRTKYNLYIGRDATTHTLTSVIQ